MRRSVFVIVSLVVVLALVLGACGATTSSGGTKVKKIGFSTDVGRIDDKSFIGYLTCHDISKNRKTANLNLFNEHSFLLSLM